MSDVSFLVHMLVCYWTEMTHCSGASFFFYSLSVFNSYVPCRSRSVIYIQYTYIYVLRGGLRQNKYMKKDTKVFFCVREFISVGKIYMYINTFLNWIRHKKSDKSFQTLKNNTFLFFNGKNPYSLFDLSLKYHATFVIIFWGILCIYFETYVEV